ncbi:MAG TPA: hypothetical protein VLE53_16585 [Gemmatimonadaceae bacterium]|nr:hypothetical protein [Gemmatimonadaceae bacterium]
MRLLRLTLAVLAAAAACGEPVPTAPHVLPGATAGRHVLVPLEELGFGTGALHGRGCAAPEHRQFDFWLGSWDVFNPSDVQVGTNAIVSALNGCAVLENWTASNGQRGRSLNSYDAIDGTWVQTWVAAGGGFGAFLLMEGGLVGSEMRLTGTRVFADFGGFTLTDIYTWTPLPSGDVRQVGAVDPPIFAPFDGRYVRRAAITPAPEVIVPVCGSRATSRELDFLLGTWRLVPGSGVGAGTGAGTSVVTTDLSQCLIEEKVTGPAGYEGLAFATWSPIDHKWYRTWVDNTGLRLVLTGGLQNGAMVLTGTRRDGSGSLAKVRVTWRPSGTESVEQRWELSRDDGATWSEQRVIRYVR